MLEVGPLLVLEHTTSDELVLAVFQEVGEDDEGGHDSVSTLSVGVDEVVLSVQLWDELIEPCFFEEHSLVVVGVA